MIKFVFFYNQLADNIEESNIYIYTILFVVGSLLIAQIYSYLHSSFTLIKRYKIKRRNIRDKEPISVVIVVRDNYHWVESTLPIILAQNCTNFEVITIDTGEDSNVSELLDSFKKLYSHLVVTRFTHNPKFPISNKMAYNIGIKSSSTNNILLTTTQSRPLTEFWVSEFADAFKKSDIVLGYAGVEREVDNFTTKLIRLTRLFSAVRSLSSAIDGEPYRGFINNLGFRKELYFTANGFNFLNMNIGEDDLFLQKITTGNNTAVLLSQKSMVVETICGNKASCRAYRRYSDYAFKFYSKGIKMSIISERLIRGLFYASALVAILLLPLTFKFIVAGVVLLRAIVVMITIKLIAIRLGEKHLLSALPLHDLIYPIDSLFMYIHRTIRPIRSIWR